MEEILIVDGYNIIGDWPNLREIKDRGELEEARDSLLNWLIEYKVYTGREVYVVFDAHQVPGLGKQYRKKSIIIYYTKENETADELIERLVSKLKSRKRRIYVATSDYTEQNVIFAQGALRISARELEIEKKITRKSIESQVSSSKKEMRSNIMSSLDEEKIKFLENWRRKK